MYPKKINLVVSLVRRGRKDPLESGCNIMILQPLWNSGDNGQKEMSTGNIAAEEHTGSAY